MAAAVLFLHADVGRSPIFAAAHFVKNCRGVTVVSTTDTCCDVVRRDGITMKQLFRLNPHLDCDKIHYGMMLCTTG
ncbi:unnamed protein product [Linum trigynum]|uniref:LysM domain-containing protein n=1 Tax=Linum trigynum TaxID=586398 RepID=A0AAV2F2E5_9ROSI